VHEFDVDEWLVSVYVGGRTIVTTVQQFILMVTVLG